MSAEFKMFQNGNVPQVAVRLLLRNPGDMPFDKLPNNVEIIDEIDVASVPDSQGVLVMIKGVLEVVPGEAGGIAVIFPFRLALLEAIVSAAGSLYPTRIVPPMELMSRLELESMVRSQSAEIDRLRTLIANRAEWILTQPSTKTEV